MEVDLSGQADSGHLQRNYMQFRQVWILQTQKYQFLVEAQEIVIPAGKFWVV